MNIYMLRYRALVLMARELVMINGELVARGNGWR